MHLQLPMMKSGLRPLNLFHSPRKQFDAAKDFDPTSFFLEFFCFLRGWSCLLGGKIANALFLLLFWVHLVGINGNTYPAKYVS